MNRSWYSRLQLISVAIDPKRIPRNLGQTVRQHSSYVKSAKYSFARNALWRRADQRVRIRALSSRSAQKQSPTGSQPETESVWQKMSKYLSRLYEQFGKYAKSADFREDGRLVLGVVKDLSIFFCFFHTATCYGVNYTLCVGPSMLPTLRERGDLVLVDMFSYRVANRDYAVGDVVISVCPYDQTKTVCKRVAAVAGDIVFICRQDLPRGGTLTTIENVSHAAIIEAAARGSQPQPQVISGPTNKSRQSAMESHLAVLGTAAVENSKSSDQKEVPVSVRKSSGSHRTDCDQQRNSSDSSDSSSGNAPIVPAVIVNKMSEPVVVENHNKKGSAQEANMPASVQQSQTQVQSQVKPQSQQPQQPQVQTQQPPSPYYYVEPMVIPPGHVWLAGDNIYNSTDSRFYGPVPLGLLRGRVFMKFKASLSEFYAWTPSMWPPPIPELKEPPAKLVRSNKKIEEVIVKQAGSRARDSPQVQVAVEESTVAARGNISQKTAPASEGQPSG